MIKTSTTLHQYKEYDEEPDPVRTRSQDIHPPKLVPEIAFSDIDPVLSNRDGGFLRFVNFSIRAFMFPDRSSMD